MFSVRLNMLQEKNTLNTKLTKIEDFFKIWIQLTRKIENSIKKKMEKWKLEL